MQAIGGKSDEVNQILSNKKRSRHEDYSTVYKVVCTETQFTEVSLKRRHVETCTTEC